MARLMDKYRRELRPKMQERFGISNLHAVPRLEKIVVSMGVGRARENKKVLESVAKDLALVTGQKPLITLAKGAEASFKIRQGDAIGCKVTLRGKRMYEFLDRLIAVVIPRIKDFRGLNPKAFDGRGNYSLGLSEQYVFPEVQVDKVEFQQGMNVALCISGGDDDQSRELLRMFGMPLRQEK
ncbi:MAG: 50S ribosomal protein L5 [Planctomycetes bacterium]|nr:50S ribosomal protein L5 [Planctomycetota bacterium]